MPLASCTVHAHPVLHFLDEIQPCFARLCHSGLPLPIGFFGLYVSNKQPIPLPWTVVVREPRLELVTASLPWRAAPGPGFVEKEAKVLLSCGDADIIVVLKALLCYFPYARHIVDR